MTTKVTVEVEYTNAPTGKMVVGSGSRIAATLSLATPPFKHEHYVHGDHRVIVREASEQDVSDLS